MKKELVDVPGFNQVLKPNGDPVVPLNWATKAGGFVFVSGLPPIIPETGEFVKGNIEDQTRQSIENVKRVLEAAGSCLENAMKVTVYCSNAGYFERINNVYRQYFGKDAPARTFVTVGSWMMDFDIEIECVALENSE